MKFVTLYAMIAVGCYIIAFSIMTARNIHGLYVPLLRPKNDNDAWMVFWVGVAFSVLSAVLAVLNGS